MKADVLEQMLQHHPDRDLVGFLVNGFRHGFDIMYAGPLIASQTRNLRSASTHEDKVSDAIDTEVLRGHTSGPFNSPPFPVTHCSPLGAVKKGSSDKVRLILDLSQPRGKSVNEGIMDEYCSVKYTSFDEAVSLARACGVGSMMAKIDIRHAFRLCPVRKEDWPLLCYYWQGSYFVDTRLPFGGRSSPAIFNSFADALTWIIKYHGLVDFVIHYLDDFFLCNENKDTCQLWMNIFHDIMDELGIPIADDKTVGPLTCIVFLGIEIDTVAQCLRLPKDKLDRLMSLLGEWKNKKKCTKQELLSLIGLLSFASKVVKPGRIFLRRLIDLSTCVSKLHHHISLNSSAKADIAWWLEFLPTWNGIGIFQSNPTPAKDLFLFTDASGKGLGGIFQNSWFSAPWPHSYSDTDINFREMFAVYVAISLWGARLRDKQIIVYCDNKDVVTIWSTGTCKNKDYMNLVRKLFFVCASWNINLLALHIPGSKNKIADILSRLQVNELHRLVPSAEEYPTPIPDKLWVI